MGREELGLSLEGPAIVEDQSPFVQQIDEDSFFFPRPIGFAGHKLKSLLKIFMRLSHSKPCQTLLAGLDEVVHRLMEGLALPEVKGQGLIKLGISFCLLPIKPL